MILMIDNYDSFTYNIVQYLSELGAEVEVHRNDEISLDDIHQLRPQKIVISPGPCTPNEAGISLDVVTTFAESVPILGICLGHQSIGQAFGGVVCRADDVMHGKTSSIHHNGTGVFKNLDTPIEATRYHSLIVEAEGLPDCFEVTAWTEKSGQQHEIMGMRHKTLPVEGVQFHPESIMTPCGHDLLDNFLQQ
ncbi:MAG: aminodeoxychorismate/anthranilate synthase component II [Pseudomonadota bacterium]